MKANVSLVSGLSFDSIQENYKFLTMAASSDYRCEDKELFIDSDSHISEQKSLKEQNYRWGPWHLKKRASFSKLHLSLCFVLFLVMKTLEMYLFTVLLTGVILALRYIPRACLSCNLKVVPFDPFFHFTHPPTSGNLQCVLSISSFILLLFGVRFHI